MTFPITEASPTSITFFTYSGTGAKHDVPYKARIYMTTNAQQLELAMALRNQSRDVFKAFLGDDCDGRYDENRLCLIDDHPFDKMVVAKGAIKKGKNIL